MSTERKCECGRAATMLWGDWHVCFACHTTLAMRDTAKAWGNYERETAIPRHRMMEAKKRALSKLEKAKAVCAREKGEAEAAFRIEEGVAWDRYQKAAGHLDQTGRRRRPLWKEKP